MEEFNLDNIFFRELLGRAKEAVFIFTQDGTIRYANSTACVETGIEDFTKTNITDIYPMSLHMLNGKVVWQESDMGQTFAYRANKTCYSVKLFCIEAQTKDGTVNVSYAINDTERFDAVRSHRKAMEEVEEANKMKTEFTANITHELRTPINGIKGMAEGLADTQLEPEQADTVNIILRCCDNMTKIINDILDFSKIETGKLELEEREFSMTKFLNDTLTFHLGKINEKGLKLMVDVSGNVPDFLVGDELRLGQILNNLFSNAIKFTSSGHIGIEVNASPKGDDATELFFMIIDTGIGISQEEKDKLFKSFSQVDGSITRRYGGTGLGLAITKQIVGLMGGKISVESEKGKGSVFSFSVILKNGASRSKLNFPEGSFEYKSNIPIAAHMPVEMPVSGGDVSGSGGYPMPGMDIDNSMRFAKNEAELSNRERDDLIEKLIISVELGSWEKAEGFASTLKNILGNSDREIKTKAFSLLLNVRKEQYDAVTGLIEELQAMLAAADRTQ